MFRQFVVTNDDVERTYCLSKLDGFEKVPKQKKALLRVLYIFLETVCAVFLYYWSMKVTNNCNGGIKRRVNKY
jgi:hypothetical protein